MAAKKSFPDLNKDGKVTKADVLKGRGIEGFSEGGRVRRPAPVEEPSSGDALTQALETERRIQEANPKQKSPKPDVDDVGFRRKKRTEEQMDKRAKQRALEEKPRREFAEGGMVRGCKTVQSSGKGFKGTF